MNTQQALDLKWLIRVGLVLTIRRTGYCYEYVWALFWRVVGCLGHCLAQISQRHQHHLHTVNLEMLAIWGCWPVTHPPMDKMAAILAAEDIFKCIFLNENVRISIEISRNFVPKGSINNIPALVQIMAWRRTGDKIDPMGLKRNSRIFTKWYVPVFESSKITCIWVRSRNCGCLVTWFCYQSITKPDNGTAVVPRPYIYLYCLQRYFLVNCIIIQWLGWIDITQNTDICWNTTSPQISLEYYIPTYVIVTRNHQYLPSFNSLWMMLVISWTCHIP